MDRLFLAESFSFQYFEYVVHSLLSYRMSAEKSADSLNCSFSVGYNPFFPG